MKRLSQAFEAEARRSAELQRRLDQANSEFEEFVATAAHNLREALRDVAAYSQLTAETPAEGGAPYLDRIRDGAARAHALLGDIVDYWATDTGGRPCRTDMDAVLSQALLSSEKRIVERSAVVTYDPLPAVMGDFEALTKVFRHLIGNAIEYCDTRPRVHISSARVDLGCQFAVRDNGPGIEPAFQSQIFAPFRRLHGNEHPGSGLGLSFCKRAIERQGGRMWLESAPGMGSTFYFVLPRAD